MIDFPTAPPDVFGYPLAPTKPICAPRRESLLVLRMVFFFRTPLLYHACGFACVVTFSVLARMTVFASLTHPHCAFKHRESTRGDTYDWSDMLLRITTVLDTLVFIQVRYILTRKKKDGTKSVFCVFCAVFPFSTDTTVFTLACIVGVFVFPTFPQLIINRR